MPFDPPIPESETPNPAPERRLSVSMARGLKRRCPACGQGCLFEGFLKVQSPCTVCGSRNDDYPSDDFAPYVTIFLVLHLMVPVLFFADRLFKPSVWVEGAFAIPLFAAACALLLPYAKGGVIGFAFAMNITRSDKSAELQ